MTETEKPRRWQILNWAGLVLTWIAGIAGVLIAVPVMLGGCLAWGFAEASVQQGAGLACHDQACVDQYRSIGLMTLVFVATTMVLIVLATWSTTRALLVALGASLVTAAWFSCLAILDATGRLSWEPRELLLLVAGIAAALALGTTLRLWARFGPNREVET